MKKSGNSTNKQTKNELYSIRFIIDIILEYFDFSVDSLLQIHAIHNLLLVDTSIKTDESELFEADLNKLELKYLEKYVNLVKNCQIEQTKWEEKIDVIYSKLVKNEYQWWMNAINEERGSDQLLRKIQDDIKTSYGVQITQ